MSNYFLILIWCLFVWVLSKMTNMQRTENINGKIEYRYAPMWAFLMFLPLIIWTGWRGQVGDTYAYMQAFSNMPESFGEIADYLKGVNKDKGFYGFSAVIKCVVGNYENVYFLVIAFIQCYFLIKFYRKYSTNFVVSFFLFIVSADYISWMFNGMRQFTAVSITLFAFKFILKRRYIPAIITVLIASSIHQSALLLIPFIFVVQGKAWNKKTLLFIFGVIIAVTFVGEFTGVLDAMLEETQYSGALFSTELAGDDGTNVFRVIVYAVPTILSLIGLKYIKEANNPVINICVNMSIVSVGFYVISIFTSGILLGRLPVYFSLYNYILLPWEIENMFTKDSSRVLYLVMIVAYLGFYFMHIKLVWGLV